MLAALNFGAVMLGVAAGALSASILALALSGLLTIAGVEGGADIGLVVGILTALATGGWVAGSRARHSHRFHGMVTGLVLAFRDPGDRPSRRQPGEHPTGDLAGVGVDRRRRSDRLAGRTTEGQGPNERP